MPTSLPVESRRPPQPQRGGVLIIVALLLPVLLAVVGLVIDSGMLYMTRRQLQTVADSAAMSGAIAVTRGLTGASAESASLADAGNNGMANTATTSVVAHNPPLDGSNAGNANAVEVTVSSQVPTTIMQVFGFGPSTVMARAVASVTNQAGPCVLVLNKGNKAAALSMNGNVTLQTNNCPLFVNGDNGTATAHIWPNATVNTGTSYFGIQSSNKSQVQGNITPAQDPIINQPPAVDPLCSLPVPSTTGMPAQTYSGGATMSPGIYRNDITISGNVTMAPGVYYINGGDFEVKAGGVLSGSGVTIFMTGNSQFDLQGSPTVNLSAPTSGTYQNVLFFGDRGTGTPASGCASGSGNETGNVMNFGGSSSSTLSGMLYFPQQGAVVSMNGNNGSNMYMIVDQLVLVGTNAVNSDLEIPNPAYYNPVASLVE